jgi:sugar lactone lactonase YvrE
MVTSKVRSVDLAEGDVAFRAEDELGEGPVWDSRRRALLWVDIIRKKIHVWEPEAGTHRALDVDQPVGAIVPRAAGGAVAAVGQGFAYIDLDDGRIEQFADLGLADTSIRMNDAKCDRQGRFWAGTMSETLAECAGSLYRLDTDGALSLVVAGVTVSNGLDWSPDNGTMYFIDTMRYGVDAFDFDVETGSISKRRRLISIDEREGLADGLTVDSDGCIWVALCFGGVVRRYTPNGRLDATVRLPATMATSCTFGGDDYRTLYITTGRSALSDGERLRQSLAGSVFCTDPGVEGLPPTPYGG